MKFGTIFLLPVVVCGHKTVIKRPQPTPDFVNYNSPLINQIEYVPKIYHNRLQYYVKSAAIEERKNPDKVILYHGERLPVWLFQEYLKQLLYPDAEDWLPLRFSLSDRNDVDARKLIEVTQRETSTPDHSEEFVEIGLSATVNLVSLHSDESAFGYVSVPRWMWTRFGGFSAGAPNSIDSLLKMILPLKFLRRPLIEKQYDAILNYIGRRRGISIEGLVELEYGGRKKDAEYEYRQLFPMMSVDDIAKLQNEPFLKLYERPNRAPEGVILQIIMNQTEAERYCYAAHPYGYVYSKDHKLFGNEWKTNDYNGEAIDPFMTYYYDNKNKQDLRQTVRIALGKDFVKYPSRVKIKAIVPLVQDEEAMRLVRLMIDEMVRQSRKLF